MDCLGKDDLPAGCPAENRWPERWRLERPAGVTARPYGLSAAALLAHLACAGAQIMIVAMLIYAPHAKMPDPESLTFMGRSTIGPEGELSGYIRGAALSMLMIVLAVILWRKRAQRIPEQDRNAFVGRIGMLHAGMAVIAAVAFPKQFWHFSLPSGSLTFPLWAVMQLPLSALLTVLAVVPFYVFPKLLLCIPSPIGLLISGKKKGGNPKSATREGERPRAPKVQAISAARGDARPPFRYFTGFRWPYLLADMAIAVFIAALVYPPSMELFLGGLASRELWFFHWTHFWMAPAFAHAKGFALNTEVYSQYGAGGPVLLSLLSGIYPLDYSHAIKLAVFYSCFYYWGIYLLLYQCARVRVIALSGVLLALLSFQFSPIWAAYYRIFTSWQWPSCTILRSPVDVWIFILWLWHLRTGRRRWLMASGFMVGLALFVESDSGIVLAVLFLVYCVGWLCFYCEYPKNIPLNPPSKGERRGIPLGESNETAPIPPSKGDQGGCWFAQLGAVFAAWLAVFAVFLLGMNIATQGQFIHNPAGVVLSWLSGLTNTAELGVGSRRFIPYADGIMRTLFFFAVIVCLIPLGNLFFRLCHGKAKYASFFLGILAIYALGRSTVFVARSLPPYIPLMLLPLSIVVSAALGLWYAERSARSGNFMWQLVPWGLLGVSFWALALSPTYQQYPNFLNGSKPQGTLDYRLARCTMAGLPENKRAEMAKIQETIAAVREFGAAGRTIAIFDEPQTFMCVEANVRPWKGDASYFYNTWTKAQQSALVASLEKEGPEIVLMRPSPASKNYVDTWRLCYGVLQRLYVPEQKPVGFYTVWTRKSSPGSAKGLRGKPR